MRSTVHATTRRYVLAVGLTTVLAGVAAATVAATAPGKNGQIAFRRYLDQQQTWGAIYTIAADGTGLRLLDRPARGIADDQPDWAPDGGSIIFTRCAEGAPCHLWRIAPDGTGLGPVGKLCPPGTNETTCPDDAHASFSPDSRRIAFAQATGHVKSVPITGDQIEHAALAIMNRDGTGRRVVYLPKPFSADLDYPTFSPDGRSLVFEQHTSGLGKPANKHAVFVIGTDGKHFRRVTSWAENSGDNPDWSPDGKWLLFHTHVDDPAHQSQYVLVHPDGTGHRQLSHFPNGTRVASASFSPDGGSIVFSKGPEGGNIDVFTMRVDGTHIQRLTHSPLWESAPDWGRR
jgi:Tol biopolymer transport system component